MRDGAICATAVGFDAHVIADSLTATWLVVPVPGRRSGPAGARCNRAGRRRELRAPPVTAAGIGARTAPVSR